MRTAGLAMVVLMAPFSGCHRDLGTGSSDAGPDLANPALGLVRTDAGFEVSANCKPSGPEVCDGVDNDCDGVADEGFELACRACPDGASGCTEARLIGAGWRVGTARNLLVGSDRGIALPPLPLRSDFIYISNSDEATVSKLRIADGVEVARIQVHFDPSRIAVDGNGDAWISHRGDLSDDGTGPLEGVIKIDGHCTPTVKPPTPTRECILLDIPNVGNLLRGTAVDARDHVFIGSWITKEVIELDNDTGMELQRIKLDPPGQPYGISVDPEGYVWVAVRTGDANVYKIDPLTGKSVFALKTDPDLGGNVPYGITTDGDGNLWFGTFSDSVFGVDGHTGKLLKTYTVPNANTRGVAVDDLGTLWAADSAGGRLFGVDRATGMILYNVMAGAGTLGVAVDHNGNVWGVNQNSNDATRVSPTGKLLGTYPVGSGPYNYSDMTGSAFRIFRKLRGTFTATYSVGVPHAHWTGVVWNGNVPLPSMLAVRVRASDGDPSTATFQEVSFTGNAGKLDLLGENLGVEVDLATDDRTAIPNLQDLTFRFQR